MQTPRKTIDIDTVGAGQLLANQLGRMVVRHVPGLEELRADHALLVQSSDWGGAGTKSRSRKLNASPCHF